MKKILFSLILVMVLGLTLVAPLASFPTGSALAQGDDPEVCLVSEGAGQNLQLGPETVRGARLFNMTIDGEPHDGWCIEPYVNIDIGCFNASMSDASRETPWCQIGYILTNYNPTSDNESAAIQLAIWKCLNTLSTPSASDPPGIETRALDIYDATVGKSVIGPGLDMTLEKDGGKTVAGGVASQEFTATITDSGCLEGIAIEFSTNNGSFSSSGTVPSKTVLTDANGKASIILYWDASEPSFTFTLTAHTEGDWPVIIDPIENIQETIISKHYELTQQITPSSVGGNAQPVDKFGILAPWIIGLALLLIGGMTWFALKRRSA